MSACILHKTGRGCQDSAQNSLFLPMCFLIACRNFASVSVLLTRQSLQSSSFKATFIQRSPQVGSANQSHRRKFCQAAVAEQQAQRNSAATPASHVLAQQSRHMSPCAAVPAQQSLHSSPCAAVPAQQSLRSSPCAAVPAQQSLQSRNPLATISPQKPKAAAKTLSPELLRAHLAGHPQLRSPREAYNAA